LIGLIFKKPLFVTVPTPWGFPGLVGRLIHSLLITSYWLTPILGFSALLPIEEPPDTIFLSTSLNTKHEEGREVILPIIATSL